MSFNLHNFSPTGDFASPAFSVEFDITSDADPIDLSSLQVYFSESVFTAPAIMNGSGQDGYNVSIAGTTISGDPGYHVEISPSTNLPGTSVAIQIEFDSSPASGSPAEFIQIFGTADFTATIFSIDPFISVPTSEVLEEIGNTFSAANNNILFQLNDANEPVITNRIPVVNSIDASPTTNIQFSVHDSGQEGVDITSLDVYIEDDPAILDGAFVSPYIGTITGGTVDTFDAFTVVINPAYSFLYEQWVDVRVRVSDSVDDPAAINTLDTTYQFRTMEYVDTVPPTAEPSTPDTGLDPEACIEFDWLDEPSGTGPDFSTLNVTLRRELTIECVTSIRDDIAVVNGVAASGYTLYSESITVGTQIGYHITICPDVPFNELETITVIVNGKDQSGQENTSSFSISTAELTPPTVLNFNPDDGDSNIGSESSIYFEMHDSAGSGVWIPYLSVNINGDEAVINGTAQTGFSFIAANDRIIDEFGLDFDGYEITITRDLPFDAGSTVDVEIDGYDAYGNRADLVTYSFEIAPDTVPPIITITPADGATGIDRQQHVTVSAYDVLGVSPSNTNVTIDGVAALTNGAAVSPYSAVITPNSNNPPIVDTYTYELGKDGYYAFNKNITVAANAKDLFDNLSSKTSSFTTFSDSTGPTISGVSPVDGQLEVQLDSTIGFVVRDAYDIALEDLQVTVNGYKAVDGGLPQSGYLLGSTRISGGIPGVDPGDGYTLTLTFQDDWEYNDEITVVIKAYDRSEGNLTTESYTWNTVSPNPPIIDPELSSEEQSVDLDTNLVFDVLSDGYGVNVNSIYFRIDSTVIVSGGIAQSSDYDVTIEEIVDGYRVTVDPRYLLTSASWHTFYAYASEPISGNQGNTFFRFKTKNALENPETLYIGTTNGVSSITTDSVSENADAYQLFDGYYIRDLSSAVINEINRLAIATMNQGALIYSTNYDWPTTFYSSADNIGKIYISDKNNGTIYLANNTKERIEVYYDILSYDVGKDEPDAYYSVDGYISGLDDGYALDMVVTEETSSVNNNSSTIFIATADGVYKIDTDESIPGSSENNGQITSYGIAGSGKTYQIIEGDVARVVAIDVNTRLNHLYVATRSSDTGDQNTLTYIDLETNERTGFIPETRLIHRLMNDIDF